MPPLQPILFPSVCCVFLTPISLSIFLFIHLFIFIPCLSLGRGEVVAGEGGADPTCGHDGAAEAALQARPHAQLRGALQRKKSG